MEGLLALALDPGSARASAPGRHDRLGDGVGEVARRRPAPRSSRSRDAARARAPPPPGSAGCTAPRRARPSRHEQQVDRRVGITAPAARARTAHPSMNARCSRPTNGRGVERTACWPRCRSTSSARRASGCGQRSRPGRPPAAPASRRERRLEAAVRRTPAAATRRARTGTARGRPRVSAPRRAGRAELRPGDRRQVGEAPVLVARWWGSRAPRSAAAPLAPELRRATPARRRREPVGHGRLPVAVTRRLPPPRSATRSRAPRARAPAPCRPTSRSGRRPARARSRARCS